MTTENPANLTVLSSTNEGQIYKDLKAQGATAAHVTNGAYAAPETLVVPTVLAGFQYVTDTGSDTNAALIIAVNSDKSMQRINTKRVTELLAEVRRQRRKPDGAAEADKKDEELKKMVEEIRVMEDQTTRALKVAAPVALQNPDRKVFVVFYDEATPNKLYETLKQSGFGMRSLFKWGYGTKPKEGIIEGAENFEKVFGFPLPNTIEPLCARITPAEGQKGTVTVADLREGALNYISKGNKCLFRLLDSALLQFAATGGGNDSHAKPQPRPAG